MKTLMTLSSGFRVQVNDNNDHIYVSNYDVMAFGDAPADQAIIAILLHEDPNIGSFSMLHANKYNRCEWSLHMSVEEAVQLHKLLPNVAFEDERVSSAESLADVGGAA